MPKKETIPPDEFRRRVRAVVRASVTGMGRPDDMHEITRLREYDSRLFDEIAESIREDERKKLNPLNC